MFTGIIEELGAVEGMEPRDAGMRLRIRCRKVLEDTREGDSISVNGVCLTATAIRPGSFGADVSPETLRRSNLGDLRLNAPVNLERPLSPGGRLGGHIMQGHVDATAEFLSLDALGGDNWWLNIRVPAEVERYLVFKGSIGIDGISLTIASVEDSIVSATIIPHTYRHTTLGTYSPGSRVNIECDVIAKYVERMLSNLTISRSGLTIERLKEEGY